MSRQLDLIAEDPTDLDFLEFEGEAFLAVTNRGWSAWIPLHPKWVAGLYYTADSYEEAIEAVDEFNQQLAEQQQKGST